ncbi:reverse transcriptase domain-containing protein [Tanacetum coccineum]
MMSVTTTFLRGEVVVAKQFRKKGPPSWRHHEATHKPSFKSQISKIDIGRAEDMTGRSLSEKGKWSYMTYSKTHRHICLEAGGYDKGPKIYSETLIERPRGVPPNKAKEDGSALKQKQGHPGGGSKAGRGTNHKGCTLPQLAFKLGHEKSLPFFKTLNNCITKSEFEWTVEAERAFREMKQKIVELPTLTAPKPREELIMYLYAAREAISVIMITKRDSQQMPIYFINRALQTPKINYNPMKKLILALVHAARRVRRYFQTHQVVVIIDQPIKQILSRLENAGRMAKGPSSWEHMTSAAGQEHSSETISWRISLLKNQMRMPRPQGYYTTDPEKATKPHMLGQFHGRDTCDYSLFNSSRLKVTIIVKVRLRHERITLDHRILSKLVSPSAIEIDEKIPELKDLPSHLEYAYLEGDESCPVIISSKLTEKEKTSLLRVLEKRKGAITWKMLDIKGISPSFCTHTILMEESFKPVIQP